MRKKEHIKFAEVFFIFLFVLYFLSKFDMTNEIISDIFRIYYISSIFASWTNIIFAYVGLKISDSISPDLFHRPFRRNRLWHSYLPIVILLIFDIFLGQSSIKCITLGFVFGFCSHLIADFLFDYLKILC
jgi:hypothetical protein